MNTLEHQEKPPTILGALSALLHPYQTFRQNDLKCTAVTCEEARIVLQLPGEIRKCIGATCDKAGSVLQLPVRKMECTAATCEETKRTEATCKEAGSVLQLPVRKPEVYWRYL